MLFSYACLLHLGLCAANPLAPIRRSIDVNADTVSFRFPQNDSFFLPPPLPSGTTSSPVIGAGPSRARSCYENHEIYFPVSPPLCANLFEQMRRIPGQNERRVWDHTVQDYVWIHRTCVVKLRPTGKRNDIFTVAAIRIVAQYVLSSCQGRGGQQPPASLGGRDWIGDRWFDVEIFGAFGPRGGGIDDAVIA
ncbi:MAG: hypothetical protein Q9167_000510 [Letrouitia subvulpina]